MSCVFPSLLPSFLHIICKMWILPPLFCTPAVGFKYNCFICLNRLSYCIITLFSVLNSPSEVNQSTNFGWSNGTFFVINYWKVLILNLDFAYQTVKIHVNTFMNFQTYLLSWVSIYAKSMFYFEDTPISVVYTTKNNKKGDRQNQERRSVYHLIVDQLRLVRDVQVSHVSVLKLYFAPAVTSPFTGYFSWCGLKWIAMKPKKKGFMVKSSQFSAE